jgi:hypothetical protein
MGVMRAHADNFRFGHLMIDQSPGSTHQDRFARSPETNPRLQHPLANHEPRNSRAASSLGFHDAKAPGSLRQVLCRPDRPEAT